MHLTTVQRVKLWARELVSLGLKADPLHQGLVFAVCKIQWILLVFLTDDEDCGNSSIHKAKGWLYTISLGVCCLYSVSDFVHTGFTQHKCGCDNLAELKRKAQLVRDDLQN